MLNLKDVLGGNSTAVTAIGTDNIPTANNYLSFTFAGGIGSASQTATLFLDTTGVDGAAGKGAAVATFTVGAGTFTSDGLLNTLLTNNQIVV